MTMIVRTVAVLTAGFVCGALLMNGVLAQRGGPEAEFLSAPPPSLGQEQRPWHGETLGHQAMLSGG